MQTTRNLLMVRPAHFGPNAQTAASNVFQQSGEPSSNPVEAVALTEFDTLVSRLRAAGSNPIVIADTETPVKPDAVFPNNWLTTHANGDVFLFPLEAPNRRAERRMDIVAMLAAEHGFTVGRVTDLSRHESEGRYLEGTGSMVLDRIHRVAYATPSTRTHPELLHAFALEAGYEACLFDTRDDGGRPIYHTNVMMALGQRFVVICAAAIAESRQREDIMQRLAGTGRRIVDITMKQMSAFAGNLLEVRGQGNEPVIVLSQTAHDALTDRQRGSLHEFGTLLPVAIDTIERVGGGSVRCMLAEIFLPTADAVKREDRHGV